MVPSVLLLRFTCPPLAEAVAQLPAEMALARRVAMIPALSPEPNETWYGVPLIVAVICPESEVVAPFCPPLKFSGLAVVGARLGPERVMVQPGPVHVSLSVSKQPVAIEVETVELLVELPVAMVVSVKEVPPFGLLMVTTELAGKFWYRAVAIPAAVDGEEPP